MCIEKNSFVGYEILGFRVSARCRWPFCSDTKPSSWLHFMAFPVGENDQEVIVFLCNKDLAQPLCSDTCCITGCSLPRPCILQVLYTNPCSHTQLLYASFFSIQRIPFKMEKMEKVLLFLWYLDFTLISSDPHPPFPCYISTGPGVMNEGNAS